MTTPLRQVFLIRHPKPDIAPGICYGSSDIQPIPEALQAAYLRLDNILPAHAQIISSPLTRCAQLASLLSQTTRTCTFDPRLAERCCGAWELQTWDQVLPWQHAQHQQVPRAELDAWAADFMDYAAPGAESVRHMQARVLAGWADYSGPSELPTRVLITHAGPIQVLLAHLTGVELSANPIAEVACGSVVLLTLTGGRWGFEMITRLYDE